ncbi:uncharacterized protein LOC122187394 isoform X2 [Lagopus leucura]|uniref:uncharacterized protein LOC122187394 isoform X2 n=1 Tax=Lagopus leucura TaxID=30410 RepID=UPI001C684972|nr:uncharacterized protein LOC122187394 isoform X2 [Lagopus leucura]
MKIQSAQMYMVASSQTQPLTVKAEDGTEFFRQLSQEYFVDQGSGYSNRRLPFLRVCQVLAAHLGINSLWRSPGSAEKNSAKTAQQKSHKPHCIILCKEDQSNLQSQSLLSLRQSQKEEEAAAGQWQVVRTEHRAPG